MTGSGSEAQALPAGILDPRRFDDAFGW